MQIPLWKSGVDGHHHFQKCWWQVATVTYKVAPVMRSLNLLQPAHRQCTHSQPINRAIAWKPNTMRYINSFIDSPHKAQSSQFVSLLHGEFIYKRNRKPSCQCKSGAPSLLGRPAVRHYEIQRLIAPTLPFSPLPFPSHAFRSSLSIPHIHPITVTVIWYKKHFCVLHGDWRDRPANDWELASVAGKAGKEKIVSLLPCATLCVIWLLVEAANVKDSHASYQSQNIVLLCAALSRRECKACGSRQLHSDSRICSPATSLLASTWCLTPLTAVKWLKLTVPYLLQRYLSESWRLGWSGSMLLDLRWDSNWNVNVITSPML